MTMSKIVIAPFSNEEARDWPINHYLTLLNLFSDQKEVTIHIVGTKSQRIGANFLIRNSAGTNVVNFCGKLSWAELVADISTAELFIGNNSGVAHEAAQMGTPTLCIFAASHSIREWGPVGPNVEIITTTPSCSPCGGLGLCPIAMRCMTEISPVAVFESAMEMLKRQQIRLTIKE